MPIDQQDMQNTAYCARNQLHDSAIHLLNKQNLSIHLGSKLPNMQRPIVHSVCMYVLDQYGIFSAREARMITHLVKNYKFSRIYLIMEPVYRLDYGEIAYSLNDCWQRPLAVPHKFATRL